MRNKATELQRKRARICQEAVDKHGGQHLTPQQGLELLAELKINSPNSLSREITRCRDAGLDITIKPPYADMRRLMEKLGLIKPPKKDKPPKEPTPDGFKRNYVKRREDEGRKSNGLCPRCRILLNTATGLTVDGPYKYCAACGWETDWPSYLPLEVTA